MRGCQLGLLVLLVLAVGCAGGSVVSEPMERVDAVSESEPVAEPESESEPVAEPESESEPVGGEVACAAMVAVAGDEVNVMVDNEDLLWRAVDAGDVTVAQSAYDRMAKTQEILTAMLDVYEELCTARYSSDFDLFGDELRLLVGAWDDWYRLHCRDALAPNGVRC